ncbi:hypothetical protein BJX63DRAFT_431199 [Aspergillus granulosus]|uniref:DUF6594 domain-containing protein n=1 Tax=Aspergillus granulosus TaxID=176169 RepID=A0ABR4HH86_9EURO
MTQPRVNTVDARLWAAARYFHRNGFITLVTPRRPFIPEWVAKRFKPAAATTTADDGYGYRVNIADMHRMYMRYLQAKLIKAAITLHFNHESGISERETDVLESTLRNYVQAVQDQEYMAKHSGKRNDPFIASSERLHDNHLLEREMGRQGKIPSDLEELKGSARPTGPWEKGNKGAAQPVYATRGETLKRGLLSRLAGALVGGAFLVGPMWLLALERDLYFQLGFTTGCVSLFGFLMAWSLDTLEAVFAASIAYAAVLMVFIGVIMQETGDR